MTHIEAEVYQERLTEFQRLESIEKKTHEQIERVTNSLKNQEIRIELHPINRDASICFIGDLGRDNIHVAKLLETILRNRLAETKDLMKMI